MKVLIAVTALTVLVVQAPVEAFAQAGNASSINAASGAGRASRPPEEPKADPAKQKADEKAYKDGLSRVPDPDRKFDPWGNVRQGGK